MGLEDILYKRVALTKNNETIVIYKIRTMRIGADKQLHEIIENYGVDSYGKPLFDPRITKVGKFLRRYWIDEIPQLYNFLKGDLKLVGIRPHSEDDWNKYPCEIKSRALEQKPGLLGIHYAFKKTKNIEDYIARVDNYLKEWSQKPILTDLKYLSKIVSNIILKGYRSC